MAGTKDETTDLFKFLSIRDYAVSHDPSAVRIIDGERPTTARDLVIKSSRAIEKEKEEQVDGKSTGKNKAGKKRIRNSGGLLKKLYDAKKDLNETYIAICSPLAEAEKKLRITEPKNFKELHHKRNDSMDQCIVKLGKLVSRNKKKKKNLIQKSFPEDFQKIKTELSNNRPNVLDKILRGLIPAIVEDVILLEYVLPENLVMRDDAIRMLKLLAITDKRYEKTKNYKEALGSIVVALDRSLGKSPGIQNSRFNKDLRSMRQDLRDKFKSGPDPKAQLKEIEEKVEELESLSKKIEEARDKGILAVQLYEKTKATNDEGKGKGKAARINVKEINGIEHDTRKLPKAQLNLLKKYLPGHEGLSYEATQTKLADKISECNKQRIELIKEDSRWIQVDGLMIKKSSYSGSSSNIVQYPISNMIDYRSRFYVGVGDLRIVKEKLKDYELADIGHIENVLAGTEKEKRHRRLESTEIEETSLSEYEEETERENQSTTKNELANEASNTATQTANVEGSLTVAGSYGPSVSFEASVGGGFTSTTTSSASRSSSFAQEVISKTVEKVRSRIVEQRRIRKLSEVEESNLHALRNAYQGAKHIRGIYRWLNKITEATIYNYGARHMFSFHLPEPAAHYIWMHENDSSNIVQEPTQITIDAGDLTPSNYQAYVRLWEATGVQGPPEKYHTASKSFASEQSSQENQTFHKTGFIKIPDGYRANAFDVMLDYSFWDNSSGAEARWALDRHWGGGATNYNVRNSRTWNVDLKKGFVPYMAYFFDAKDFGGYFNLHCELMNGAKSVHDWRNTTFDAIQDGYRRQLAEFEEKMLSKGPVQGSNPLSNQLTIRNELKRYCMSLFLGIDYGGFNGFLSEDPTSPLYWKLNISDGLQMVGKLVNFFERAFEWENMTYLFYPYYHGRRGEWSKRVLGYEDADPLMASFLRAGHAKVLVPARPELAELLIEFAQTGELPIFDEGGEERVFTADDHIQEMIDEVRSRGADNVPGAVPDPDVEPWEVKVPSSLVLLQDLDELKFRDLLGKDPGDPKETQVGFHSTYEGPDPETPDDEE